MIDLLVRWSHSRSERQFEFKTQPQSFGIRQALSSESVASAIITSKRLQGGWHGVIAVSFANIIQRSKKMSTKMLKMKKKSTPIRRRTKKMKKNRFSRTSQKHVAVQESKSRVFVLELMPSVFFMLKIAFANWRCKVQRKRISSINHIRIFHAYDRVCKI